MVKKHSPGGCKCCDECDLAPCCGQDIELPLQPAGLKQGYCRFEADDAITNFDGGNTWQVGVCSGNTWSQSGDSTRPTGDQCYFEVPVDLGSCPGYNGATTGIIQLQFQNTPLIDPIQRRGMWRMVLVPDGELATGGNKYLPGICDGTVSHPFASGFAQFDVEGVSCRCCQSCELHQWDELGQNSTNLVTGFTATVAGIMVQQVAGSFVQVLWQTCVVTVEIERTNGTAAGSAFLSLESDNEWHVTFSDWPLEEFVTDGGSCSGAQSATGEGGSANWTSNASDTICPSNPPTPQTFTEGTDVLNETAPIQVNNTVSGISGTIVSVEITISWKPHGDPADTEAQIDVDISGETFVLWGNNDLSGPSNTARTDTFTLTLPSVSDPNNDWLLTLQGDGLDAVDFYDYSLKICAA